MNDRVLPHVHFLFQCLRLPSDPLVLVGDRCKVRLHPSSRVSLSLRRHIKQLGFVLVPEFSKISFSLEHLLQIAIFDCFLLNIDLHFPQFRELLLELFPEGVLLGILRLKLPQALIRFLQRLSDIPVLLLAHANGLILLGQRDLV